MPILWASCSMGFLRCPGFSKLHFFNLHKICAYLILTNLIVLIDKLLINICIEYKYVLLLQLTEKKITIFLSVGILEHSPLTCGNNAKLDFPLKYNIDDEIIAGIANSI